MIEYYECKKRHKRFKEDGEVNKKKTIFIFSILLSLFKMKMNSKRERRKKNVQFIFSYLQVTYIFSFSSSSFLACHEHQSTFSSMNLILPHISLDIIILLSFHLFSCLSHFCVFYLAFFCSSLLLFHFHLFFFFLSSSPSS